jgi:diacylglycerol kinase (ATP)
MRVTVLHNPSAGDEGPGDRALRALLRSAGYAATFRSTQAKGWKQVLGDPGDLVVVAGGDGTVAKVVRQLAGRGIPVALLPTGTANNIARSLNLNGDAETLVARWSTARVTPVDLGVIEGSMRRRRFVEGVGLGVLPQLMTESARRIPKNALPAQKEIARNVELMIALLERARPLQCEITADGHDLSGAYLALEIMNIRSLGPRVAFSPDADLSDGLLDIVAIAEEARATALDFLRGSLDESQRPLDVVRMRARKIHLAWGSRPIHIDDKQWPKGSVNSRRAFSATITVEPGAIELLV